MARGHGEAAANGKTRRPGSGRSMCSAIPAGPSIDALIDLLRAYEATDAQSVLANCARSELYRLLGRKAKAP